MENLTNENVFVGAAVRYRDEDWQVVKVNKKTVYISQSKNFIEWWNDRPKGMVWKKFCNRYGATMVSYSGIEIDEVEVSRGRDFVKEQEKRKKEKRFLDSHEEKEVEKRFKMFKKGKGFGGPITTELGHGIITVIVNASPDGMILLRKRQAYFFYDIYKNKYFLFKMLGEKKKFEWPTKEVA